MFNLTLQIIETDAFQNISTNTNRVAYCSNHLSIEDSHCKFETKVIHTCSDSSYFTSAPWSTLTAIWSWSLYAVSGLHALLTLLRHIESMAGYRGPLCWSWSVALFSSLSPSWMRSSHCFEYGHFRPWNRIVEWNELKMFCISINGLNFRSVIFQLCITRPLATHLTFLKQLSSSVNWPANCTELEWKGNTAADMDKQWTVL